MYSIIDDQHLDELVAAASSLHPQWGKLEWLKAISKAKELGFSGKG